MVKTKENLECSQRAAEQHSVKNSMNDIIKNKEKLKDYFEKELAPNCRSVGNAFDLLEPQFSFL